jgi:hypothetical protein
MARHEYVRDANAVCRLEHDRNVKDFVMVGVIFIGISLILLFEYRVVL